MKPYPALLALFVMAGLMILAAACANPTPATETPAPVEPTEILAPPPTATVTPPPEPMETLAPSPTATVISSPGPTATATPQGTKNIPYIQNGNASQVLDIYLPEGTGPFPVVFALHGGNGDKGEFNGMGKYLAGKGYALVAVNFRDMPDFRYPANVQDAYCAFAWMQANAATYGLDPQRVVVAGFSLGGSIAALMSTVDDPATYLNSCQNPAPDLTAIKGSVIYTGIFDFPAAVQGNAGLKSYFQNYFGSNPDNNPARWQEASAVNWLDGSEKPFLLIHGETDESVPPKNSQDFSASLKQNGISVQLILVPNADHMGIIYKRDLYELVEAFIAPLLK